MRHSPAAVASAASFEDDSVVIYAVRHGLFGEGDSYEEAMDDLQAAWVEWGGDPAVLEAAMNPNDEWIAEQVALWKKCNGPLRNLGEPTG